MSTNINAIKGRYEKGISSHIASIYDVAELDLIHFYSGTPPRGMLQLTISSDRTAYIQLTKHQVEKLSNILLNCLADKNHLF